MTKGKMDFADKVIGVIGLVILLSGLGWLVWDAFIDEYIQLNAGLDEFCKEQGYNKSTAYIHINCGRYVMSEEYRVECDGEKIFPVVDYEFCIKSNKWGQCSEEGRDVEMYRGNTTC